MKLLDLLSSGDNRLLTRLTLAGGLAGGGSAVLLAIVNAAAEQIEQTEIDKVNWFLAGAFIAVSIVYFFSEIYLVAHIGARIENGIHRVRARLLTGLANADFARIERFGRTRLYESITQSSQVISQNSQLLAHAFRSLLLVLAVMLYVLWLSPLAFFLIVIVIGFGTMIYLRMGRELSTCYHRLAAAENSLFERVADLFYGIKEVRMSSARSDALNTAFAATSAHKEETAVQAHDLTFRQQVMGMMAFYILLAVIVFVVPVYSPGFSGTVMKVSTAVLFMIGPISAVVQSWTVLGAAENAASRMISLDADLAAMAEPVAEDDGAMVARDFTRIGFHNAIFRYAHRDQNHGFQLGPVTLEIARGELIFITGGNGSGKSTLIKLLTALYYPTDGHIEIDDIRLGPQSIGSYRHLISTVFSDFHLFSHLYGLGEIDRTEAAFWLRMFELDHITGINIPDEKDPAEADSANTLSVGHARFVRQDLSQGQRKRLALIAAILEHRPILVLDEWAADQDPHFRRKFYREILPELCKRGLTVVAVTHDDHYFDAADRCLHLEAGQLHDVAGKSKADSVTHDAGGPTA